MNILLRSSNKVMGKGGTKKAPKIFAFSKANEPSLTRRQTNPDVQSDFYSCLKLLSDPDWF